MRLWCRPSQASRNLPPAKRGLAGAAGARWSLAKPQLANRFTLQFLHHTLDAFNRGDLDSDTAAKLPNVNRAHRFRLRAAGLQPPAAFTLLLSGGNHLADLPADVQPFLQTFLPLQRPPSLPAPGQFPSAHFQATPPLDVDQGRLGR